MKPNTAGCDTWVQAARSVPIEGELARRGIKLKRSGNELIGPCPRCGGDDRFGVSITKQVFNCRGCGVGGDVIDLVQHLDDVDFNTACETLAGAAPPKANGRDRTAEPKKIGTAKYVYKDEAGAILFAVLRYEFQNPDGSFVTQDGKRKKTFRQKRPNPDRPGEWLAHIDGVPVVPYRLPEVTEAIANNHAVLIVEGETKADLLWSWNVPATCCAGGAGKWKPEHSVFLRGADVVILPDNDAPGRKHCDVVGASLRGIAARIRIVELPGLPPKGDIVDWAAGAHTREELDTLIGQASDWQPLEKEPPQSATVAATLESAAATSFKMEGVEWLWPNRFALGKLGLLAGLPDRGKGLITADMAARITTGDLWPCGEGRALQGNVLLLSAEDDIGDTIVPRLVAAGADLSRIEIIRMVRQNGGKRQFSLVTDLTLLRQKIEQIGNVRAVIIDPLSAYLGVGKIDSYRTTDVRGVLAPVTELAAEKRILVLGVLHFNKKTDVTSAMLRISDSLAFAATARHCYVVVDDPENQRRLLVKAKNNLAPDTKALAFGINTLAVGQDERSGKSIWAPRVVWGLEHVEITATEAMEAEAAGKAASNPRAAAKDFLTELLAAGPVPKQEIEEAADANCISARTLIRAKADLGVVAKKTGLNSGWTWQLPEQQQPRPAHHAG